MDYTSQFALAKNDPSLGDAERRGRSPTAGCRGPQYAWQGLSVNDFDQRVWDGSSQLFRVNSRYRGGEGILETLMAALSAHRFSAEPASPTAGRPLASFEQLMLLDDRPGHPMCFFLENRVSGPLQEDRFREAVEMAARRHPLLCSRVGTDKGHPVWLTPDVLPKVTWNPSARGSDLWRSFDLRRESGMRIVVLSHDEQRHRVVMQVHHSTCDGIAACEFFGDVWAIYAGLEPRAFSQPRTARFRPAADHAPASPTADGGQDKAREAWSFASFWPTPLACVTTSVDSPAVDSKCDPRSPPYMWLDFDQTSTDRLRAAAAAGGVSLNDSIIAAVMRAAVAWNTHAGRRPGNVRVTMPVNLRQPGQREPANNDLGYAFLDRTAAQCTKAQELATSIATATRWILDHNAAAFFLDAIAFLARWPWLLRLTTRLPLCISTVVVSNIGDPSRRMRSGVGKVDGCDAPADLVIRGSLGVPPLRPRTRAAIGVTTYAGRLSLCCICSAHPDPREGARQFLDLIRRELVAIAEANGGLSET